MGSPQGAKAFSIFLIAAVELRLLPVPGFGARPYVETVYEEVVLGRSQRRVVSRVPTNIGPKEDALRHSDGTNK